MPSLHGEAKLLSDTDVQTFLRDGFIVLRTDDDEVRADLHSDIARRAEDTFGGAEQDPGRNPSDYVHDEIPEMGEVFGSPTIDGALTS